LLLQPTKLQTQIAILNVIRSGFGFRFPAAHRVKLSSRPASSFSVRASFSVWELLAKERSDLTTRMSMTIKMFQQRTDKHVLRRVQKFRDSIMKSTR